MIKRWLITFILTLIFMWIFVSVFWSFWITCSLYIRVLQRELLVFPLMIWSIRWKFVFSRNLEMIHMQHQINEYSIYIRFFWSILDLFIFTISKVMILSIVHITRYVKQILAITWWSVWACLWWRVKFSWLMRFLSLWMSLLVDFISIMQVLVLRSFRWQDMFFSQICFQLSDKID